MRSRSILSVLVALTLASTGCASAEEEDASSGSADALTAASNDYEAMLADIERAYDECKSSGQCKEDAEGAATGGITPQSLQPLAMPKLVGTKLCSALKPFARLESPYFFVGGNANLTSLRTLKDGGIDLVFDLRNLQAAVVRYNSEDYSNAVGAELNVYAGYAFGRKANVLEAWSGQFRGGDVTIDTEIPLLSAGAMIFYNRDKSVVGGAVEASVGVNFLKMPLEFAAGEGERTPMDGATRAYGRGLWWTHYREVPTRVDGHAHTYIQFNGVRDLGVALVQSLGTLGFAPAATAAGLAALRNEKLTITQACH